MAHFYTFVLFFVLQFALSIYDASSRSQERTIYFGALGSGTSIFKKMSLFICDSNGKKLNAKISNNVIYAFPGMTLTNIQQQIDLDERIKEDIKSKRFPIVNLMLGTNDCARERYSTPVRTLIRLYRETTEQLFDFGVKDINVLRPPPKTDQRLNEKLENLWEKIEEEFERSRHIHLHALLWEKHHLDFDGIHINEDGRNFLEQYLRKIRLPATKKQFGTRIEPSNYDHKMVAKNFYEQDAQQDLPREEKSGTERRVVPHSLVPNRLSVIIKNDQIQERKRFPRTRPYDKTRPYYSSKVFVLQD